MKGLTSSDSHTSSEAIARADEYLERSRKEKEEERKGCREGGGAAGVVVEDRTVINRSQESSTASDESSELNLASQVSLFSKNIILRVCCTCQYNFVCVVPINIMPHPHPHPQFELWWEFD